MPEDPGAKLCRRVELCTVAPSDGGAAASFVALVHRDTGNVADVAMETTAAGVRKVYGPGADPRLMERMRRNRRLDRGGGPVQVATAAQRAWSQLEEVLKRGAQRRVPPTAPSSALRPLLARLQNYGRAWNRRWRNRPLAEFKAAAGVPGPGLHVGHARQRPASAQGVLAASEKRIYCEARGSGAKEGSLYAAISALESAASASSSSSGPSAPAGSVHSELLAARRVAGGWKQFLRLGGDRAQRLRRLQLVIAAREECRSDCVSTSRWFQGPFLHGPGQSCDVHARTPCPFECPAAGCRRRFAGVGDVIAHMDAVHTVEEGGFRP